MLKKRRSSERRFSFVQANVSITQQVCHQPLAVLKNVKPDSTNWLTPGRFSFGLALLLSLFFLDVLLGWKTFFHHDFAAFGYPLAHYHRECFWRGELPLWNPLSNAGLPFLAQWNTLTLYPGSLIYLLLPLPWSLNLFGLVHLFLAGLGMYFLAFRWVNRRLAAGVAGVVFAGNGLAQCALVWPNNVAALALMPWVLLMAETGWKQGGRHLLWAGLTGALQMLSGAPELILFTWIMAAAIFAEGLWGERSHAILRLARSGGIALLIFALSAAQLLPFLDLLKHSQRNENYSSAVFSMPGTGWANLLIPLFRCYASRYDVYFQFDQHWTSSYYLGIGTILLAIFALVRLRQTHVWVLAVVSLLGLLLALGENGFLYPLLRKTFPSLGFMNFPIKFVALTIYSLPLLAAYGVARCEESFPAERRFIFLLSAVLLIVVMALVGFEKMFPLSPVDWTITARNAATRAAFLLSLLAIFYFLARATASRTQKLLQASLLFLFALDLMTYAPRQNPTIAPAVLAPGLKRDDLLPSPVFGQSRVWIDSQTHYKIGSSKMSDPSVHLLGLRLMLHLDLNLLDAIPKMNGFFSLYLREAEEISRVCENYGAKKSPGLFNFLSISHIPDRAKDLEWMPRDGFLPMITAGQKPVFAEAKETLRGMVAPGFDPQQTVFLPPEAQASVMVSNQSLVKIVKSSFAANRVELEVTAEQPGMVVMAQTYYHPWGATVDGVGVRLWRANHAFQALAVPAGSHHVVLQYRDKKFFYGVIISIAAGLFCLLALFASRSLGWATSRRNAPANKLPPTAVP